MISLLRKCVAGEVLSPEDTEKAVRLILEGIATPAQTGAFLTALSMRGETPEELAAAVRVLHESSIPIKAPENAVDCCGTGGDLSGSYNISTAVALVSAACGVPVAKHGNRAATSKSGAADVLEALGIRLETPVEKLEEALRSIGFAFLMARIHHPALASVAPLRKELGFRTLFNVIGPLANPARTRRQLVGVFSRDWLLPMARTLDLLGAEKAWVVHGSDGLDELTVTGPSHVAILEHGTIIEKTVSPADFGLPEYPPEDLKGGDAQENAKALEALLDGQPSAYRDCVLMNAAAVLSVAGVSDSLEDNARKAAQAIDSGAAKTVLDRYREVTRV